MPVWLFAVPEGISTDWTKEHIHCTTKRTHWHDPHFIWQPWICVTSREDHRGGIWISSRRILRNNATSFYFGGCNKPNLKSTLHIFINHDNLRKKLTTRRVRCDAWKIETARICSDHFSDEQSTRPAVRA